ncbi:cyanophycin synthetase [Sphingobacterium paucimobilis]|uniref:Cyanophycin synthetase n=1 Tax=Sphingobacterium paucimobilis HER1398 TaxID=1346330 RepID=U2HC15_9SPHI|nr:cyanophycin synthetase [Sphingobacterium paucimobilis]ERJ59291.1 hypothetical protein M472_10945 [Sphingobacterium paucimobilis HER1398]
MNILKIRALRGPNYWSVNRTKLIQMTLDIGDYETKPSNKLAGFADRLEDLLPSLFTHRCSEGVEGGFFTRLREGTWLGHVIEHVALELQCLAGMECGFGRTRGTGQYAVYNVVFSYLYEKAGIEAAKYAVGLVQALAENKKFDLEPCLEHLRLLYREERLGPSTQAIVDAAVSRNIPWRRLNEDSIVMLGYGNKQRRICATVADSTSNIAVELAQDKAQVKAILAENNIPVPNGEVISHLNELDDAIQRLGYPLAIKPVDGNHGRGVTTHILNEEEAILAFHRACRESANVMVERFVRGEDYRFLVINYKVVAISRRSPAKVTGDGKNSIRELITIENSNPLRGEGHDQVLTRIKIDKDTEQILKEHHLSLDHVLPSGTVLHVKDTANLSTGGTAEDVTDIVPQLTKRMMERVARLIGLDVCGIDVISSDIQEPMTQKNGAVLEVNAAPGFRMHTHPSKGQARDVGQAMIDLLFPRKNTGRIPIIGVTGTNGKTTTTLLTTHLLKQAGKLVGTTTTEGIYIDGECIAEGDCSGPASATVVLQDPAVECAVLECARGGMLRAGLGFDRCDISIVTNVAEDHLGIDGINDLEDLTRVKRILPESTYAHGIAVLNADDENVFQMSKHTDARIALFSLDKNNQAIADHFHAGGLVVYLDEGWIMLGFQQKTVRVIRTIDIPITMDGKYDCMIQNSMTAVLATFGMGVKLKYIRLGLKSFYLTTEMNVGRMNEFVTTNHRVVIDYAHNGHGYAALERYLNKIQVSEKVGIITATGDRRDKDIINIGKYAARIFDTIIIRHDKDCRGRTPDEITILLTEGMKIHKPNVSATIISDEEEAIKYALEHAPHGSLIFLSSDDSRSSIKYVEKLIKVGQENIKLYGS